ncbi:MAG: 2Fe-2S iron-sulfur cluster-binding protein [Paracoccaceae bacterium]|nr:2Fe-2S iron-sulfur cluster-binding protein [Paracoccaceae bacterium]
MKDGRANTSGLIIRTARIWSGLFMLAFVTTHLINLSLGVISIDSMKNSKPFLTGIWSNPVMGTLLLSALFVHFFLGLWAIYKRPTLQTNLQDLVQLFSGLTIVPLMATHVVGVMSLRINGLPFDYAIATKFFWLDQPAIGLLQVILLSAVWVHGCAGFFTWLRSKAEMRHILGWLYPIAVAVPVLALIGYAEAGRGVLIEAQAATPAPTYYSTQSYSEVETTRPGPPRLPYATVKYITNSVIWWSLALAAVTLLARELRVRLRSFEPVRLQRGNDPPFETTSKLSVFDSFRAHKQPHAGLCEGRGRCGTCAVRIVSSEFPLPEPTALEIKTLGRINAPEDVRLACQLTPSGGFVETEPVYPADYAFTDNDYGAQQSDPTQASV